MRWYFGYPVLAAGLMFGAQTLFPGERAEQLTLRPAPPPAYAAPAMTPTRSPTVLSSSELANTPRSRLAAFSPGQRLLKVEPPAPAPGMFEFLAQRFGSAPLQTSGAITAVEPVAHSSWKSAVVHVAADAPVKTRPVDATQRVHLARDVQRELQRVGCYHGEIDGIWGPGSQRAVMAFMEHVNAVLPVEEPDVFMLSLLTSEKGDICGATCPHGQSLSAGGRCLPTTLLAHHENLEPRRAIRGTPDAPDMLESESWEAVVAEASAPIRRTTVFHGRMGVGGPKPGDDMLRDDHLRPATTTINSEQLHRTASIDTPLSDPGEPSAAGLHSQQDMAEPIVTTPRRQAKARTAERPRPAKASGKRWRSNRQVQSLFQHPLGRM